MKLALAVLCLCVACVAENFNCFTAPSNPGDRRTNKAVLKVATFNPEWLFDGSDGGKSPWTTPAEADAHLKAVAGAVATMDADYISFEEVQDCNMLQRLADLVPSLGYKPYLIKGTDTATGQNVGVLTKVDIDANMKRTDARFTFPIAGSKCGYTGGGGTTGVSKHYYTRIEVGGLGIQIIGVHYIAFPTVADRCVQREGQASVTRELINNAIAAGDNVIVLGDMNDYSDDVPDANGDVPLSRAIAILRDGIIGVKSQTALVEVAQFVQQSGRYSSEYEGDLTQIDHILASTGLVNRMINTTFEHIFPAGSVSDHWPVVFTFSTPTN